MSRSVPYRILAVLLYGDGRWRYRRELDGALCVDMRILASQMNMAKWRVREAIDYLAALDFLAVVEDSGTSNHVCLRIKEPNLER